MENQTAGCSVAATVAEKAWKMAAMWETHWVARKALTTAVLSVIPMAEHWADHWA